MQREKNKNRVKSDEENQAESTIPVKMAPDSSTSDDPNAPQIDEDGQSHNIDNAEQKISTHPSNENVEYEYLTTNSPTDMDTEITTLMIDDQISQTTPSSTFSPLPTESSLYKIDSEKVNVIEIKSDGSSGHLSPLNNNK